MIPILFDENETQFVSNGIGGLADASSCLVTEVRNGQLELEMQYPVESVMFPEIQLKRFVFAVPSDGEDPQPFEIYNISKPINGIITVKAHHMSYRLNYTPCRPFTASSVSAAMSGLSTYAMETCPFTFWTDKTTQGNYRQTVPASIRSRLGGVSGSILDVYGGEYEFDMYTVKLHNHRGADNGVELRYGKNITDIKQEENIATTYTGAVGYWNGQTANGDDVVVQTDVIQSQYASSYPYHRTVVIDASSVFQTQPTQAQLTTYVQSYMTANNFGIPKVSIKVSFVALWQTEEYKYIAPLERVKLCDTVTVEFEKLGISAKAKVVKTVYNVLLDKYNSIEIGEARTNLADRISEQGKTIEDIQVDGMNELEKAITRATKQITGQRGGYVVINQDANGNPFEILIMDTPSIQTAQKIWRWNNAGWGYSYTGYNGPYGLAATQDGEIVADFITTGVLTANIIRAGILRAGIQGATSYWNLQTGEFYLDSSASVGDGQTIGSMKTSISATASGLTAEVSRATGAEGALSTRVTATETGLESTVKNGEISSKISQEAGQITISSDRFVLDSTNCKIAADGSFECKNSFTLKDSSNNIVAYIDQNGNLHANKGWFEDIYVKNQQGTNKVQINKDGTAEFSGIKINNGSGNQSVGISQQGKLTATGAEIDGELTAGGITMKDGKLIGLNGSSNEWGITGEVAGGVRALHIYNDSSNISIETKSRGKQIIIGSSEIFIEADIMLDISSSGSIDISTGGSNEDLTLIGNVKIRHGLNVYDGGWKSGVTNSYRFGDFYVDIVNGVIVGVSSN